MLVVFSHPNHELAIFGLLQRLRPRLVFLTDGGGEGRLAQTRHGLESIGLIGSARFLNHSERSFYDALIARDSAFFEGVAHEVRDSLRAFLPKRILCDAIEFYNPVHDMSLPVVRAAVRGLTDAPIFEVPLIYQRSGAGEQYEVQRMPASRRTGQIEFQLSEKEVATKIWAREQVYTILTEQVGPVITGLSKAHVALEVVAPASVSIPEPADDVVLRYEWRAKVLAERGEIKQEIDYRHHYLPVASSLLRT